MNDKIYPSMVIRSQAETIELLEKENTQLKSVIKEIRECIDKFPDIHYASVEKVNGKRLSGKLVPVDDLLQILDKGDK